jgi:hemerythrin-like metal-binding protein
LAATGKSVVLGLTLSVLGPPSRVSKAKGRNTYTISKGSPDRSAPGRPWITLDESLILNYPAIDQQHQVIAGRLNDLNAAVISKQPPQALTKLFEKVVQFVADHFDCEEQLMAQFHYPEQDAHSNAHKALLDQANSFRKKFSEGNQLWALQALKDWFVSHIENDDKPLANYLRTCQAAADVHLFTSGENGSVASTGRIQAPMAACQIVIHRTQEDISVTNYRASLAKLDVDHM